MPQLDAITFATQIFWLLLLFVSFYFFVLKHILPNILLNLKVRQTALEQLESTNSSLHTESISTLENFNKINLNLSQNLNTYLLDLNQLVNKHLQYVNALVTNSKQLYNIQPLVETNIQKEILKHNG